MFADIGGVPAVFSKSSDGDNGHAYGAMSGMWIFALVIIFLALAFLMRRDGYDHKPQNGYDPYAPLMAATAFKGVEGGYNHDKGYIDHKFQDLAQRDIYAQEFAIKEKIVEEARNVEKDIWHLTAQNKDQTTQFLLNQEQQTSALMREMNSIRDQFIQDRLRTLELENSNLRQDILLEQKLDKVIQANAQAVKPYPWGYAWPQMGHGHGNCNANFPVVGAH